MFDFFIIFNWVLNNATAKYDSEGYFSGLKNTFRKLVSCSNCTDYQARTMETWLANKETKKQDSVNICGSFISKDQIIRISNLTGSELYQFDSNPFFENNSQA